jgi:hypothetical protein
MTYSWNNSQTTSSITVAPTSTTIYTVTITSGSCSGTESAKVTVAGAMNMTVGNGGTICFGESFQLNAYGATSYSWTPAADLDNPGISDPMATPSTVGATIYTVTGSNGACSKTESIIVTALASPSVTSVTFNSGVLILNGSFPGKISQISINSTVYNDPWSASTTQAIFNNGVVLNCGDNIYVKTIDAACVTVYPYTCTAIIEEKGEDAIVVKQNEQISLFNITGGLLKQIKSPKDFSRKDIYLIKDLFVDNLAYGCYFWRSLEMTQKFIK